MSRVERLTQNVLSSQNQAILIHKPSNIYYLSGYTGEGILLISEKIRAIITDFRYTEQAGKQSPDFSVYEISSTRNHIQYASELVRDSGVTEIFYEDDYVTVTSFASMQKAMPSVQFVSLAGAPEQMRRIKDEGELTAIGKACDISCEAFEYLGGVIVEGMSEREIQLKLDFKMLELGAEGLAFNTIVASGPNGSLPHAVPGDRKVRKGDMITIDFGAKFGGYCADMTRNVAIGQPTAKLQEIFDIVLETQEACEKALAPGKICSEIDAISRKMIGDAGYGAYYGHGLGHGVGIDIHEMPTFKSFCAETLVPGHVMTVEPGIYLPGIGGVRIENTYVITEDGARSLVRLSKKLLVL